MYGGSGLGFLAAPSKNSLVAHQIFPLTNIQYYMFLDCIIRHSQDFKQNIRHTITRKAIFYFHIEILYIKKLKIHTKYFENVIRIYGVQSVYN